LPKLNEFPENLRCSNINGSMHKLLVGECLRIVNSTLNERVRSVLCKLYIE